MKYQVMYDNGSRLRVRSGQWAFTKREGYGLASLLLNQSFVQEVFTSHRNGSILIYYDGDIESKQKTPHVVKCPHCGKTNPITGTVGKCSSCRSAIEYHGKH